MDYFHKKHEFLFIGFITLINCTACGNNVALSPKVSRFIASEHLKKFSRSEKFFPLLNQFIKEEQASSKKIMPGASSFISSYSPENSPQFPLSYYLIPEEDIKSYFSQALDQRVSDQLIMKISGKKHYKFFIHPELETHFDYLRSAYSYIGVDKTEFIATPTSNYRALFIWNKNNLSRRPFIAKVSLDKKTQNDLLLSDTETELERSMAFQHFFENRAQDSNQKLTIAHFPETSGFNVMRIYPGKIEPLQGQIIQEIPEDLFNNKKKWTSLAALLTHNQSSHPLILDIITKTGMTSYSFIETYMVNQYLTLFEELSLKQGIHFEPNSFNLLIEMSQDLKPSGKWIFRNFENYRSDVLLMAKNQKIIERFMTRENTSIFKFLEGRSRPIKNFVVFYRPFFNNLINEVAKNDPQLSTEKISELTRKLDNQFLKLINAYYNTHLTSVPSVNDYHKIEPELLAHAYLDPKMSKKEIEKSNNLTTFITNKKKRKEWLELNSISENATYYLAPHGLYVTDHKKIVAFALFSPNEFEDYNAHNKMLSIFKETGSVSAPTECARTVASILEKKKE
jgi:hypothetical protein